MEAVVVGPLEVNDDDIAVAPLALGEDGALAAESFQDLAVSFHRGPDAFHPGDDRVHVFRDHDTRVESQQDVLELILEEQARFPAPLPQRFG